MSDYARFDSVYRDEFPDILGKMLPGRGVECGSGWMPIIMDMLRQLRWVREKAGVDIHIGLIKEKFGWMTVQGVRFSKDTPEEVQAIVSAVMRVAEGRSGHTCEVCGKNGEVRRSLNHISALCDEHFQEARQGHEEDDQC